MSRMPYLTPLSLYGLRGAPQLGQVADPRVGSLDVDRALDHRKLQGAGYRTIQQPLERQGYVGDERQPFIFHRNVHGIDVKVDILAGECEGTGRVHCTQSVEDARPRKARGCDLAFDAPEEVHVEGALPDGALDSATVRVASIVPLLVMKGMTLVQRLKEKDAYYIYYCVLHYIGGAESLAEELRPHLTHGLVQEGLQHIAARHASPDHTGPRHVAAFLEVEEADDREPLLRDAYERVHAVLESLGLR
jgi:hypothetical protein